MTSNEVVQILAKKWSPTTTSGSCLDIRPISREWQVLRYPKRFQWWRIDGYSQYDRVVLGNGIVHVTGDAKLPPTDEKELRRKLVQKALEALQSNEKV